MKGIGKNRLPERRAQPAELAPACVFLSGAERSYVTGSIADLAGGRLWS